MFKRDALRWASHIKSYTGMSPLPLDQAAAKTSALTVPPLPSAAVGAVAALGNPSKSVKLSTLFNNQGWRYLQRMLTRHMPH